MPVDRVQPLKLEDTSTGGDENDLFPTGVNRNEDYLDCRGVALQSATSNDDSVRVERSNGDLGFLDVENPSVVTLSQLMAGGSAVFGRNYQTAIATSRTTTTSSTFQDKTTLTTPALTGTYRVGWSAVIDAEAADKQAEARLYNVTNSEVIGVARTLRSTVVTDRISVGGFAEVAFTGAAKTFKIQFKSVNGSTTVGIQDARIELWRVS